VLGLPARSVAATVKYTRDEPGGAMALRTEAQRRRREAARALRERAAASRAVPQEEPVQAAGTSTVWRSSELPTAQTAQAGVPLSEGITSVLLGAVLYIPVALVTSYASWNYLVALVLVLALSYALCSRRVVAGPGFVAVRKFGPYRVAQADAVRSRGDQTDSARWCVDGTYRRWAHDAAAAGGVQQTRRQHRPPRTVAGQWPKV